MSKPWAHLQYLDQPRQVVVEASELLETVSDPLDRHSTYVFLEKALYQLRDSDPSAISDFEAACERHHQEMSAIRPAMVREFGGVVTLWTHRQMAVHKKKVKDFPGGAEWCRRGLEIYGVEAIQQDSSMVEDLRKRLEWFESKL